MKHLFLLFLAVMAWMATYSSAQTPITVDGSSIKLTQGDKYTFEGVDNSFYLSPDFWTANSDGSYTFNAVTGLYQLRENTATKYIRIAPVDEDGKYTVHTEDGKGGLYVFGTGIGLATYPNAPGWTTYGDAKLAVAEVKPAYYQLTVTVGKELSPVANAIDFKFYGDVNNGHPFIPNGTVHALTNLSDQFDIDDKGHVKVNPDVVSMFVPGTKIVMTIDLTQGSKAGEFSTDVTYPPVPDYTLKINDTEMTHPSGYHFVYEGNMKQNQSYTFTGADVLSDAAWYYDPDFFTKNSDGSYTFKAVDGRYHVEADVNLKFFKVYGIDDDNNPLTLQDNGTGELWMRGNNCFGKPSYATNAANWGTDISQCHAFAQVSPKVYRMTLVVGKQIDTSNFDMKNYFQAGNGGGFIVNQSAQYDDKDALAASKKVESVSYFKADDSEMTINKKGDEGIRYFSGSNHFGKNHSDTPLTEGDVYEFTYDVTKGIDHASLTIKCLGKYSTGIGTVKSTEKPVVKGIYTLQGVKLSRIVNAGVYVVNGKKVVVK